MDYMPLRRVVPLECVEWSNAKDAITSLFQWGPKEVSNSIAHLHPNQQARSSNGQTLRQQNHDFRQPISAIEIPFTCRFDEVGRG